jgi:hypothetical protein
VEHAPAVVRRAHRCIAGEDQLEEVDGLICEGPLWLRAELLQK